MNSIRERLDAIHRKVTQSRREDLAAVIDSELDFLIQCLNTVSESVYERVLNLFIRVVADTDEPCERIITALSHSVPHQGLSEHVLDLVSEFLLKAHVDFFSSNLMTLSLYLLSHCHNKGRLNVLTMIGTKRLESTDTGVDPVLLATHVAQFWSHQNSRVRIAAINTIDRIIRWRPWKSTYPIICVLLGREEEVNVIPLAQFYDENFCRKNFIACAMFEDNAQVRLCLFRTLIDWVTTLEDKADIEGHLLPFILTGELDEHIGSDIRSEFHKRYPDVAGYVARYSRRFFRALLERIDCDFLTIRGDTRDRLLIHTVKYLGSAGVTEFIPDLFKFIERRGVEGMEEILDIIAESKVDWYDVLVMNSNTIDICVYLLRQGKGNETSLEKVRRWISENMVTEKN